MKTEFFIYFLKEELAQEARIRILAEHPDSDIKIQSTRETHEYICIITMFLDRTNVQSITVMDEYFEGIADELGGDYDGSGTFLK